MSRWDILGGYSKHMDLNSCITGGQVQVLLGSGTCKYLTITNISKSATA